MTAQIIRILATSKTPRYRPMPAEPATVIILPVIRVERPPMRRSKPSDRLASLRGRSGFEAKMRRKYKRDVVDGPVIEKPCDT